MLFQAYIRTTIRSAGHLLRLLLGSNLAATPEACIATRIANGEFADELRCILDNICE